MPVQVCTGITFKFEDKFLQLTIYVKAVQVLERSS